MSFEFHEPGSEKSRELQPASPDYAPIRLLVRPAEYTGYMTGIHNRILSAVHLEQAEEVYGEKGSVRAKAAIEQSMLQHFHHRYDRAMSERNEYVAQILLECGKLDDSEVESFTHPSRGESKISFTIYQKIHEFLESDDETAVSLVRALEEIRGPSEALDYFLANPELDSIEIASMIHPLDWGASRPMHEDVGASIHSRLPGDTVYRKDLPDEDKYDRMRTKMVPVLVPRPGKNPEEEAKESDLFLFHTTRLQAYSPSADISIVERFNYIIDMNGLQREFQSGNYDNHTRIQLFALISSLEKYARQEEIHLNATDISNHQNVDYLGNRRHSDILQAHDNKQRYLDDIGVIIYDILDENPEPLNHPWMQPTITSYYAARDSKHAPKL